MATGIPKERSIELISLFGDMLSSNELINELDYRRFLRELQKDDSPNNIVAIGLLHAAAGRFDKAFQHFETAIKEIDDQIIAHNYCFVLEKSKNEELYRRKTYEFAKRYGSKKLTATASDFAYRYGDLDGLIYFMDEHIKLLSEDEGRSKAEKHKQELIEELNDAYSASGCTKEQFETLARIMWNLILRFDADVGLVEVSRNKNNSYVLDIKNKSPEVIAEMNFLLAEAVCSESLLDGCELTGRFSPNREIHEGVSYVNY